MSVALETTARNPLIGLPVLVVDDHASVAESIVLMLRSAGVAATHVVCHDHGVVLDQARAFGPRVVLLDYYLGDDTSHALVEPLTALPAAVIMFTGATDRVVVAETVAAGAVGVIDKTQPNAELLVAVAAAATTGAAMSDYERQQLLAELRAERARRRELARPFESLTAKERQVLHALDDGLTAAEIAESHYVSVFTVRGHIRSIHAKLGVSSQLAAVAMARRAGWPTFETPAAG